MRKKKNVNFECKEMAAETGNSLGSVRDISIGLVEGVITDLEADNAILLERRKNISDEIERLTKRKQEIDLTHDKNSELIDSLKHALDTVVAAAE